MLEFSIDHANLTQFQNGGKLLHTIDLNNAVTGENEACVAVAYDPTLKRLTVQVNGFHIANYDIEG